MGGTFAIAGGANTGAVEQSGGSLNTGGTAATGGTLEIGGATATGGALETGGDVATGGVSEPTDTSPTGGIAATGGMPVGGSPGSETVFPFGGRYSNGGRGPTGGTPATGGTSPTGGFGQFGGRSWSGTTSSSEYSPLCAASVTKDEPCYGQSGAVCYKTCGPSSVGFKSETCQGGVYVEQQSCSFPTGVDYSCYKLPVSLPNACPYGTPQASQECQVPQCTVCFGGTLGSPTYRDSTGTQKIGYCVCGSAGTWTCASTSSWPCPDSNGCK